MLFYASVKGASAGKGHKAQDNEDPHDFGCLIHFRFRWISDLKEAKTELL